MDNLIKTWEKVKEKIIVDISKVNFNTWIKPLSPLKREGNNIYIYSAVSFVIKIVNNKYKESIEEKFRQILNEPVNVIFLTTNDDLFTKLTADSNSTENTSDKYALSKPTNDLEASVNQKTPDNYIYAGTLNKKYTFDKFVRGKSNDLAVAIATNVSNNPGTIYNPFFIYGESGLGKTHLMQAIGHKILEDHPEKKVIYITSENFMNEFISTITDNKNSVSNSKLFRDKYRNCDVLMIDDIQFISGKEITQQEIFHTFNSLQQAKKQIIFTSDKKPEEIKGLEDRLVTRFNGGMLADIQKPDFETRVAIIKHKIDKDKYNIPDTVIRCIAENVTSNIRELEGATLKVLAFYNLEKKRLDEEITEEKFLEIAKNALAVKEKKEKVVTLEYIKKTVTKYYGLEKNDLISKSRQKTISDPRQIAMHLSRQLTNLSLVTIANSFERDHATVIYGDDKIKKLKKSNKKIKKEVEELTKMITSN